MCGVFEGAGVCGCVFPGVAGGGEVVAESGGGGGAGASVVDAFEFSACGVGFAAEAVEVAAAVGFPVVAEVFGLGGEVVGAGVGVFFRRCVGCFGGW